jgi:tryptophan halogenase
MIRRILVLGGGSAGMIAAATCKITLPQTEVVVLRSSAIGIIGVGEGTLPTVPLHLHDDLQIDLADFYREVQPSWKLGLKFLWGTRSYFNYTFAPQVSIKYQSLPRSTGFYLDDDFEFAAVQSGLMTLDRAFERRPDGSPNISLELAYHLENEKLVAYLERHCERVGVLFREGMLSRVEQDEHGIQALHLESGERLAADLFIDCSGFRSMLLGEALDEPYIDYSSSLFCDAAVVGGWPRTNEPIKPYTTCETMDAGWCWQIEHQDRITRGYVYSSSFISDEAAEAEFRRKNPQIPRSRIVRFKTGRYARSWVKNVVAIGNSAGFVEPLESTALAEICTASQGVARSLRDCDMSPTPSIQAAFNHRFARSWDNIRAFLAVHYKFNRRLETPFWQAAQNDVDLAGAEHIVRYYQENGPSTIWRDALVDVFDQFKLEGWYTLLLGMQVPYRARHVPTPAEQATWRRIQQVIRQKAEAAFTCEQALQLIASPAWSWNPDFYRQPIAI